MASTSYLVAFSRTAEGLEIPGIDLFKMETHAGPTRLIGNIVTEAPFGELVGYENHSGLTVLDDDQPALGVVRKGAGNNGEDKTEGAIYRCVFGSYLHGSLLPKTLRLLTHLSKQQHTGNLAGLSLVSSILLCV